MTKKEVAKLILKSTPDTAVDIDYQGCARFSIEKIKYTSFFTWTLESSDGISRPKDDDGRVLSFLTYNKARENLASYLDVEREYEDVKNDVMFFVFSDDEVKKMKSGTPFILSNLKEGETFTIDNQGDNVTRIFMLLYDKAVCIYARGMRKDYEITLPLDMVVFRLEKKG